MTESPQVDLGFSLNQNALANAMSAHFGAAFGFSISSTVVGLWLSGRRLPKGAKAPPTKINGKFNNNDWALWMESTFKRKAEASGMPVPASVTEAADEYERLNRAKLLKMESDAGVAKIEFERAKEKYITVEHAQNLRRSGLRLLLGIFKDAKEAEDCRKRAEWLALKLSPADLMAFQEFDLQLARACVDAVYAECARLSYDASEAELAKRLAEEHLG